jgi:hypothetical protein
MSDPSWISRRDVLRGAGALALASASGMSLVCRKRSNAADDGPQPPKRTTTPDTARVVLVRNEAALDERKKPVAAILQRMLDEAVSALFSEPPNADPWLSVVSAEETVGIKSNVWRYLRTPPALEDAIRARVRGAGVPDDRISVDDRGVLDNPVFQKATALINVRPMRTHHWAGVGSCIKNYIMFSQRPPAWHDDACANLAGLWDLPHVAGKTRLNILVMLTPLFHGKGPHHFQTKYLWDYRGLVVGTDPVAVDATGLRILEAMRKRRFGAEQPFAVSPKHIRVAAEKYKLGVADPQRIEIIRIGPMDDALI